MKTFEFIKQNFSLVVIALLVIIILLQRSCTSQPTEKEIIKIEGKKYEVIKRDTVIKTVTQTVYRPGEIIYKEVPIYVEIPTDVDTLAILKNYFAINVYKDTLHLKDSLGYVSIIDSITQNGIKSRYFDANINKFENNTYLKELNTQLYLGGSLGIQKPDNLLLGANAFLKTKQDKVYGISIGVNSHLDPYIYGTLLWKISFKR